MTFQHRAGVSPYTSPFGLAETCVFDKQSPGPFHCDLRFASLRIQHLTFIIHQCLSKILFPGFSSFPFSRSAALLLFVACYLLIAHSLSDFALRRTAKRRYPFSRSYGVNLPSSLTTLLPLALGFSPHLPVSVCGTDVSVIHTPFLARSFSCFPTLNFQSLGWAFAPPCPGLPSPGSEYFPVSACLTLLTAGDFPPHVHRLRLSASP